MKKKVCMFVWNRFYSDARVKREAAALNENNYYVKVVCAYDNYDLDKSKQEVFNGYIVKRILTSHFLLLKTMYKLEKLKNSRRTSYILFLNIIYYLMLFFYKVLSKIKVLNLIDAILIIIGMIKEGLKEEFDIYHSNDLKTLPQGIICSKIFRNKKIVYDSHEVETGRVGHKGRLKYYLEKTLIDKVDKVLMTTETRANYNAELYNIIKPEVIHNYPVIKEKDLSKFNLYEIANIPKDEPIFLYQGGIQPYRGLEKIIEAIPKFKRGVTVFVGDGKCKSNLETMVNKMGIKDKVRFLPKVASEDLLYYSQHAFLGFQVLQNTCFNHYSALSNKLLEYVMVEIPVIASDFPEIKKIVTNEKVGVCINPHDIDNISNAVNFLVDNMKIYKEYKTNCKKARLKYNWENEKKKLLKIYNKL